MPVSFIFPPFVESALNGPHLAAPLLSTILENEGVESRTIDLNIRLIRRIFCESPDVVRNLLADSGLCSQLEVEIFNHVTDNLPDALNHGWATAIKGALSILRPVLFPLPPDLETLLGSDRNLPTKGRLLYEDLIDGIGIHRGDTVGVSVAFAEQLPEAIHIAAALRRRFENLDIVLGGSQINLLQPPQIESLSRSRLFDSVLIGNGELSILARVTTASKVSVIESGPITEMQLAEVPFTRFRDLEFYFRPLALPVLVTKGCYWGKCTFCDYVKLSDIGSKSYLARSASTVFDEICSLQREYRPESIILISDAIPPAWYRSLARLAIANSIKLNTWSYMMHSNALTEDFFSELARAGVKCINFGTESFNDRLLAIMKKPATAETAIRNLKMASSSGITTIANIIPDYPSATFQEALEVAETIERHSKFITVLNPQMFDLTASTPVSSKPELYAIKIEENAYTRNRHGFHGIEFKRTEGISELERSMIRRTYQDLTTRKLIERRAKALLAKDVDDHSMIVFDRSMLLSAEPEKAVSLLSLGASWALATADYKLLKSVIRDHDYTLSLIELMRVHNAIGVEEEFSLWLRQIIESGMVIEIRSGSGPQAIGEESIHATFF